jgi:hypothetical protein
MVIASGWYLERYMPTSRSADWWKTGLSFERVRAHIQVAQRHKTGEIFRFIAPIDTPREELAALAKLGARPT